MSKYQYELSQQLRTSMRDAVESAHEDEGAAPGDDWYITVASEYIIEALNRTVAHRDGTLNRIILRPGTASEYVLKPATRNALREELGLN